MLPARDAARGAELTEEARERSAERERAAGGADWPGEPDERSAAPGRAARLPPARGEAAVVGVLRPAAEDAGGAGATRTPRRSADSNSRTTWRSREDKQSCVYPLRFPPQQHKIGAGDAIDPATEQRSTVTEVDDAAGLLWMHRGAKAHEKPLPRALIPGHPFARDEQRDALRRFAQRVIDAGVQRAGRARCELLELAPASSARRRFLEGDRRRARASASRHSTSRVLFIQGPPGSGQDVHGRAGDRRPAASGRRVGVAATAHKAIHNLLDEIEEVATAGASSFRGLKKSSATTPSRATRSDHIEPRRTTTPTFEAARRASAPRRHGWLWAREGMRERGRRAVHRRGRPGRARRRARDGPGGARASSSSATHSSSPTSRRAPTRAAPARPSSSTCSATRDDDPPGSRRVPRPHLAHAPRRLPLRVRGDVRGAA